MGIFLLTVDGEGGLCLPVTGPVGELSLIASGVVWGDPFDGQAVSPVLLEHVEVAVLQIKGSAVLGPPVNSMCMIMAFWRSRGSSIDSLSAILAKMS